MGGVQCVSDLEPEPQHRSSPSGPAASRALSVAPSRALHDDERPPALLADVVDGADVRVVERRRRLRLALEAAQGLRSRRLVGQELEGHRAAQPGIVGR